MIKLTAIFISFLFFFSSTLCAQRYLTKDEIRQHWIKGEESGKEDSTILGLDGETSNVIRSLTDSLRTLRIDSIIIYAISYPGYIGKSTCIGRLYPVYTYLIWKVNTQTVIKKIEGNCLFDPRNINSTVVFEFYNVHQQRIKTEFIIPAIYSGQIIDSTRFSYIESWTDHEPKYFLYYSFGKDSRLIRFTEHDLQDKESLFHDDNLNSNLYLWWKTIDEEVKK